MRASAWLAFAAWLGCEWRRRGARPATDSTLSALWATGAAALALHVGLAFALVHGWSHAAAAADVARQTQALTGVAVGAGVYVNDAFLLLWSLDAAWWRRAPAAYAARPRALDVAVRAFAAFMFVNGAVVFAHGPLRAIAALGLAALAGAWIRDHGRRTRRT